jgi:REP element-mobilizing transposase RayT
MLGGLRTRRRGARTLDDMARKPRCFGEGIYHLSSDGSDIRQLFLSGEDRLEFLKRLATTCERFEVPLISYVLMGNHYHAVVRTPDDRVSEALQFLHTGYSRNHNRRNARSAHLFRAHPFAREIEGNDDFLTVIRYLALNPVAAGFVRHPLDWPWSSARAHAGVDASMIPLDELLLSWCARRRSRLGEPLRRADQHEPGRPLTEGPSPLPARRSG